MKIHGRCTVRFCALTPDACSSLTAQASGGWRQNINREGCISNENDFASVRLTMPQIHLLATEWRMKQSMNIYFR